MYLAPEHLVEKRYEKYKANIRPYDFFEQIDTLDFENLGVGDRIYLQDYGIFNSEIEEESFMLRVRVPGGRIRGEHFVRIAEIAESEDLSVVLTARSGLQLHGLEAENVLAVFREINAMEGLSTWQTFGDNVRNVVTDPYDGRGQSCEIEAFPIIEALQAHFLKNPELVGMLPRRISIGITGMRENSWPLFSNDLFLGLAEREGVKGFNVYMGGKNTEISQDADIFIPESEAADFAMAVVMAFDRYGLREKRMKSRLYHMIEHYGMAQVKAFIAEFYQKPWEGAGRSLLEKRHFGDWESLADGSWGYRHHTDYGLILPHEMAELGAFVQNSGAELRIGIDQQLYLLGLAEKEVPFSERDTSPTVVACAGSDYCPFSYWSIKKEAHYLPVEKLVEHDIKVGFSGCMKGCGRHKHTDIGIVGLRNAKFGRNDQSARIFLGYESAQSKKTGEVVFRTVPAEELNTVVSLLIEVYEESGIAGFERFTHEVLNRFDEAFLEFFFLARRATGRKIPLDPKEEPRTLAESFGGEDFVETALKEGWKKGSDAIIARLWHAETIREVAHMDPSKRRSR
ncbi:nitrite/sulfite reductase [Hydrogenimonas sp. SS33]|uniref:nitrite/sulfite reductase n=1 Tax=Hydrogenimonas leucolamina TaxID=2954236 RepID=UPI00336C1A95